MSDSASTVGDHGELRPAPAKVHPTYDALGSARDYIGRALVMLEAIGPSPEKSQAITKLLEANFWAGQIK